MKSFFEKILLVAILVLICYFSVLLIISKKVDFSENENRYLEDFPKINLSNYLDGKLAEDIQSYLGDHFPLRSKFLFITTKVEKLLGKKMLDDVYFANDGYLITTFDGVDNKKEIIKTINNFVDQNKINTFVMLIPSSLSINQSKLPKYAIYDNELDEIEDIYKKLNNVNTIDVFDTLYIHNKKEQMFYFTDHHWTSDGAYYSYLEYCKAYGKCTEKDHYNIEKVTNEFYGTLYSKTNNYDNKSDDIYIYNLKQHNYEVNYVIEKYRTNLIYDFDYLKKKDKYSLFLSNNHPLITITNNDSENNDELLLIKDSYGNSFSQFLINDYKKIHIIDLRYYVSSVSKYISENPDINNILLLYSINTLDGDTGILNLK